MQVTKRTTKTTKRTTAKRVVPTTTKLAVVNKSAAISPPTTTETLIRVQHALVQLGQALSNLTDREVAETYSTVRQYTEVLEAAETNLKARLLPYIRTNGTVATEKGTVRLEENGWTMEAQPTRTGYDPKKVESLLRMNGIDPEQGMDATVSYKVNEGKLATLLANTDQLTTDQVEATRYDLNYRVIVKRSNTAAATATEINEATDE